MRKCRNWQTSKTKDLVVAIPCGFKSHLPHENREEVRRGSLAFFLFTKRFISVIINNKYNEPGSILSDNDENIKYKQKKG